MAGEAAAKLVNKAFTGFFNPVAAYDYGISGIGGRGVWKGQGRDPFTRIELNVQSRKKLKRFNHLY